MLFRDFLIEERSSIDVKSDEKSQKFICGRFIMPKVLNRLRITEIFYSLQGEGLSVGIPTVFIRLTGCPLRCQYCDTAYAFHGGLYMQCTDVLTQVRNYATRFVCVTGGEPLAQPACLPLLTMLCDQEYIVSLETSGALDVSQVDRRVIKVIDIKTPKSQEAHRNYLANFEFLYSGDQVKFVICDRSDYEWAKNFIATQNLLDLKVEILFSPSYTELNATELAEWILTDQLPVRLQIQLHKYLWGNAQGK